MLIRLVLILSCLSLFSCQKPVEENGSSPAAPGGAQNLSGEATTDCGVVFGGKLSNPVSMADGEEVRIKEVMGNNLVSIQSTSLQSSGPQLLKLHGVASGPSTTSQAARNMIRNLAGSKAYFYKASEDCETTVQGGKGTIGHLISSKGVSINESLISAGLADVDTKDACGGDMIAGCFNALKGQGVEPMGEMKDFLWKPKSDTKGDIVVILEKHCATRIVVNGTEFKSSGASNGRCNTSPGTRPGCAYGSNIKVEVIDINSGRPYTYKGKPYVVVPNGCQRFEFK